MKKIFLSILILLISFSLFANGLIHPLDFRGTEKEKQEVIDFIKQNVYETYTAIGMGNPATLRMMEKEELDCFKKLTLVTNRQLLDEVIDTYCSIDMGSYNIILMMYEEELKASKQSLEW